MARREAKQLSGLVANGRDPAEQKAKARLQAADTLRVIVDQYLRNAKQTLKPRTYSEIERYLLVSWKPLHPVSVFQITRRHISARIADIASGHGKVSAARARTALSSMFNWAIREGLDIAANPVLGTNEPRSREAANGSSARRSYQPSGGPVAMTITDALCVCCCSQPNAVMK